MGRGESKGTQQPWEVARGYSLKSSEGHREPQKGPSTRVTSFPGDIRQPLETCLSQQGVPLNLVGGGQGSC